MPVEPISCKLTPNDMAILETILERLPDASDPLAVLLRAKLAVVDVHSSGAIPPNVVTINSRVTYRLEGCSPHTVVIVQAELPAESVPHALSIHDPLGLVLLGLSEGDAAAVMPDDGWPRTVIVEKVVPRSEQRHSELTETSRVISFPARAMPVSFDSNDGDDPGPSAA